MHIASLVMGIVSLIFSWIPVWGFILAIVALVISIIAMAVKKAEDKGKGMKIAGIILSIFATIIALVVTIGSVLLLKAVVDTGKEFVDDVTENVITDTTDDMNDFVDDVINSVEDVLESTVNLIKIQELNKEVVSMYLAALNSGSPEGRAQIIMGYPSYQEMDSHYTDTIVDEIYKVTDIDYSSFEDKLSGLSQELVDKLYSFKPETNIFKNHDGKLAIHQGAWTGVGFEFVSQELISNNLNEYTWKVVGKEADVVTIYNVTGKLENENYVLVSVSK